MQPTLTDRLIARYAPGVAVNRLKDRARFEALASMPSLGATMGGADLNGGESPTRSSRSWWPFARGVRADTLPLLPSQRGASRALVRTSPIAAGAINTNVDRVVGTGLALSAQPNRRVLGWSAEQAAEWKLHTQAEFSLWADSSACDQEDKLTFYEKQGLTLRSAFESGDCFTLMPDGERSRMQPYALRLQTLEADRVGNPLGKMDTPTEAAGIRLDAKGRVQAFHLYDQHPGDLMLGGKSSAFAGQWVDRVGPSGRRRMLQHFRALRPGQPRGVPYLAPIVDCLKQISRYTEAEIMAAVISAYFTVFVEAPGGNSAPIFDGAAGAGGVGEEIGMGMGAVVGLAPGEKAQFADPSRPNPNFAPFIEGVLTQIGMALGLPRELLMKQFNSSYSASKAALLDAWVYFRGVRFWLAGSFCQPVYETWLAEAVAIGRVPAPGFFADPLLRWAYTRAAWPGDSMGSINPKDEVAAYVSAIDARLMTRERAEWELWGTDFNDTLDAKQSEQAALKAADLLPVPKAGAAAPPPGDSGNSEKDA